MGAFYTCNALFKNFNLTLFLKFLFSLIYIMPNPWIKHVKDMIKKNSGKPLKEVLTLASVEWKKKKNNAELKSSTQLRWEKRTKGNGI